MEDRELKDREVEIKREIEELFVDDIDKFEKKKRNEENKANQNHLVWLVNWLYFCAYKKKSRWF